MTTHKSTKSSAPRVKESFLKKGVFELKDRLGIKNIYMAPRLEKIVLNIGVSAAKENIRAMDVATAELTAIAGQKPVVRRAKKSVSAFKLRVGVPIGLSVTLRGDRMYEFLDRFVTLAVPRIRDFRGLNPRSFDGNGNYNVGIQEQYIFPEVNAEKSDAIRGMNITFATSTRSDKEAFELLSVLGVPFSKQKAKLN